MKCLALPPQTTEKVWRALLSIESGDNALIHSLRSRIYLPIQLTLGHPNRLHRLVRISDTKRYALSFDSASSFLRGVTVDVAIDGIREWMSLIPWIEFGYSYSHWLPAADTP